MKKIFILVVLLIPLYSFGVGFNDVPWVKYTQVSHGDTWSRASVNLQDSMVNNFSMHTYAYNFYEGYHYPKHKGTTTAEAGAIKTNFCDSAPFVFKAYVGGTVNANAGPYSAGWNGLGSGGGGIVLVSINGGWSTVWDKQYYTQGFTEHYGDSICINVTSGFINGILVASKSYAYTPALGSVDLYAQADNTFGVNVNFIGIEESTQNSNLKTQIEIYPNPFTNTAKIRYQTSGPRIQTKIKVYDISGKLVEETNSNAIGKNLEAGIYFVKAENSDPVKVIKLK